MKNFTLFIFAFVLCFTLKTNAQQLPLLSSYYYNTYLSNPAFAGLNGNKIFLLNRRNWKSSDSRTATFLASYNAN